MGKKKLSQLESLLDRFLVIPINDDKLVEAYAELDAYSQGKLSHKPLGQSARNMGKNDLWIAATAYLTQAVLLTTNNDFNHLDGVYFTVENLN